MKNRVDISGNLQSGEENVCRKIRIFWIVIITLVFISSGNIMVSGQEQVFSEWKSREFIFQGHEAKIVFPKQSNKEKYWVWRARFWGHEPQVDKALLNAGFHLVYVDVSGLFGNSEAVGLWNDFYDFVSREYKLNPKTVLEGMSRGGLIVYNWASQNTGRVACIYADAPVCDIKSWPGGLYSGVGSPGDWEACLKAYHLDGETVLTYDNIPLKNAVKVAQANIPVIHVCGLADDVVPYSENTEKLATVFREAGGEIELILKEGVGHHPHCLKDPKPIVDFILNHTLYNH